MIVPARWYTGGRGLDDFRASMLSDKHIREIVDYPNPYDCFQGVDIAGGICYFLWDRENEGECQFTSVIGKEKRIVKRILNEYPVFIRDVIGLNVVKKVESLKINSGKTLDNVVSSQTPFGIITSYKPTETGVPCWFRQKIGLQKVNPRDVKDLFNCMNKYKLLIPEAPIAGQTDFTKPVGLYYEGNTIISNPGECCTQTWLVANSFDTKEETEFFRTYLLTKTVRFLILQTVISQHVSREKFCFVPDLGTYDRVYTDDYLKQAWGISEEEWAYIDSRIHNYGGDDNG
jgi:site-specific DNA-methyltransferase (adenine-specific)